jgi:hypothetical protein
MRHRHRHRPQDHRTALAVACVLAAAFVYACSSGSTHPAALASDQDVSARDGGRPSTAEDAATTTDANADANALDGRPADTQDAESTEAAGDAGAGPCNALIAEGPQVAEAVGTGAPPPAVGGTIFPGTYWLTSRANYGGTPDVFVVQRSILVTTTGWSVVEGTGDAGSAPPASSEGTWSLSSFDMLNVDVTCPTPRRVDHYRFTADGSQLTLFPTNESVEFYALQ